MNGGSWTGLGDGEKFTLSMESLTGVEMLTAHDALSAAAHFLRPTFIDIGLDAPRFGKIVLNAKQGEMGLYVDEGFSTGVAIALRCPLMTDKVEVTVTASSKLFRGLIWACLGVGVVLGLFGMSKMDWAPKLKFALGLLAGAAIGVGLMWLLGKMLNHNERSQELQAKLAEKVRPLIEAHT